MPGSAVDTDGTITVGGKSTQSCRPVQCWDLDSSAISAATLWAVVRNLERFEPVHALVATLVFPLPPETAYVDYRRNRHSRWDEYVGLSEVSIEAITARVIMPQRHPELVGGSHPRISLLISGAPGTGKTTLAKIAAAQCNATLYVLLCQTLADPSSSLTNKFVERVFKHVRSEPRAMLLLHEITALLPGNISNYHRSLRVRMLEKEVITQLEQGRCHGGLRHCTVLATCSTPWEFAHSLRCRVDTLISTHLPDRPHRKALFIRGLAGVTLSPGVDLEMIALQTRGHSGGQIEEACADAMRVRLARLRGTAVRETSAGAGAEDIEWRMTMLDISEALSRLPEPVC